MFFENYKINIFDIKIRIKNKKHTIKYIYYKSINNIKIKKDANKNNY